MTKPCLLICLIFAALRAHGDFGNYNSILIGEEAAGLGGAYTALSGDPAGGPFYNPAGLARMDGNTLSAAVSVYNKNDTQYGELGSSADAPLRVNRGSILPIPAASGTVYTFGNFAFGLSIVFPDFDQYAGQISNTADTTSYLNLRDESLWVGGSLALNLNQKESIGLTMYYTSRTYNRSILDETTSGGVSSLTSSEKSFSQNSLVYILGYQKQLNDQWSVGASVRLPSLPVNGRGTFFQADISSGGGPITPTTVTGVRAHTKIPPRVNVGVGYNRRGVWKAGADLHWYGSEEYEDFEQRQAADPVVHESVLNASVGGEYYVRRWLALRGGLFTNFSSHPKISETPTARAGDHLDMWGFATNVAVFTSKASAVTLGGYYTGGKGYSVHQVGQQLERVPKAVQIFSFLVGTSFYF
jgi:long-chain fatty acid transport protein